MRRLILSFVVLFMSYMTLSGCIIVPWGHGHHFDDDFHDGGHRGGGGHGGGGGGGRGRH